MKKRGTRGRYWSINVVCKGGLGNPHDGYEKGCGKTFKVKRGDISEGSESGLWSFLVLCPYCDAGTEIPNCRIPKRIFPRGEHYREPRLF